MRRAQEKTWQLVDEGTLEEGVRTYVHDEGRHDPPPQSPTIEGGEFGGGVMPAKSSVGIVGQDVLLQFLKGRRGAGKNRIG